MLLKKILRRDYKNKVFDTTKNCLSYDEIYSYAKKTLPAEKIKGVESHIAECYHCLDTLVSIYDGTRMQINKGPEKRERGSRRSILKNNIFMVLSIASFILSFVFSGYFLQFLTATIILGVKWIVDSKTNRMLVMIYEAWRKDGERGASRVLRDLEAKDRIQAEKF